MRLRAPQLLVIFVLLWRGPAVEAQAIYAENQIPARGVDIEYTLTIRNPISHLYDVEMDVRGIRSDSVDVAMPAWEPGNYTIRDFAKNVQDFRGAALVQANQVRKAIGVWGRERFDAEHQRNALRVLRHEHPAITVCRCAWNWRACEEADEQSPRQLWHFPRGLGFSVATLGFINNFAADSGVVLEKGETQLRVTWPASAEESGVAVFSLEETKPLVESLGIAAKGQPATVVDEGLESYDVAHGGESRLEESAGLRRVL